MLWDVTTKFIDESMFTEVLKNEIWLRIPLQEVPGLPEKFFYAVAPTQVRCGQHPFIVAVEKIDGDDSGKRKCVGYTACSDGKASHVYWENKGWDAMDD